MIVVGLTGGIGSGKTTVAGFFKELDVPVYIADNAGTILLKNSTVIREKVIAVFGEEAYQGKEPNRKYISSRVFTNPEELEALNQIIHPAVEADFEQWKQKQSAAYVVYEAAILFEKGGYKKCDFTILVTAPTQEKIKRLLERDKSTPAEIEARMNNQWSDERKKKLSNFEISNLDLNHTRQQVENLHKILLKAAKK